MPSKTRCSALAERVHSQKRYKLASLDASLSKSELVQLKLLIHLHVFIKGKLLFFVGYLQYPWGLCVHMVNR